MGFPICHYLEEGAPAHLFSCNLSNSAIDCKKSESKLNEDKISVFFVSCSYVGDASLIDDGISATERKISY